MKNFISRQRHNLIVPKRIGLKINNFSGYIGFSLVELMVTVTVLIVLVGVGAASLSGFNRLKEVEEVRSDISGQIKLAKNLAVTRQLPNKAFNLKYVRVGFSGNKLSIVGVDSNGNVYSTHPYSSINIKIDNGVGVTIPSFGFMAGTGRLTDTTGKMINTEVVVNVTRETDSKMININSLGIISDVN